MSEKIYPFVVREVKEDTRGISTLIFRGKDWRGLIEVFSIPDQPNEVRGILLSVQGGTEIQRKYLGGKITEIGVSNKDGNVKWIQVK